MRKKSTRRTGKKVTHAHWLPSLDSDVPELQALVHAAKKVGTILNVAMLLSLMLFLLAELSGLLAVPFDLIMILLKAFHIPGFLAPWLGRIVDSLFYVAGTLFEALVIPLALAPFGIVQRFWQTARLTKRIEAIGDPATIPLLLWMYFRGGAGTGTRKRILSLLNRLSMEVTEDKAQDMDSRAIKQMNRALKKEAFRRNEGAKGLCLMLIQILQFMGNSESVRIVAAIAGETGRRSSDPALVELAARVLPDMHVRVEAREAPWNLLRASEAPEDPDTLLRPAAVAPPEPSEQLLRPKVEANE